MQNWNQLPNVWMDVPMRSAGNTIMNRPVEFEIYRDGELYKAVPLCNAADKTQAMLKEELQFYIKQDKAVSVNGIKDGNQHIVELLGEALKMQATNVAS